MTDDTPDTIYLLYDGQCPVCHTYVTKLRIEKAAGKFVLISAREPSALLDEVNAKGINIDEGMVLKMGNQLYHGKEAIHRLALLGTKSGVFNRINFLIFRSRTLSTLLYPLCKCARDILLWALRIPKIQGKA